MSVLWTINGSTPAALGLEIVGGSFRTGAPGEMTLRRVAAFDATPLYSYGQTVSLVRGDTQFFRGKVVSRPVYGRPASEGQTIRVMDAWQDLEDTIYQEPWAVGTGSVNFPIAILGLDDEGDPLTTGEQIEAAINYAISAGVDLQLGTVPAGLPLWPMEVRNISCAEVIRISTRLHPDWVPWIDYATTPPTLHVTARAAMTEKSVSVAGEGDVETFDIERRDDLKPAAVIITYQTATIIDGVTYRDTIKDKWPSGGPDAGPRVLSALIELAGGQMQFQKSRIQTRTIPDDESGVKAWLKLKFPSLAAVDDADMDVISFTPELIAETETLPDPINPLATRLSVADVDDLPRELVRGTIEDWMRKKVGQVHISFVVEADPGASDETKAAIASLPTGTTITATNAVTKIYKGVTQWVAPEAAPAGIAQAVYEALETYQFQGSVTLVKEDVTADVWHGRKLNIGGGLGEWATMDAAIHQSSFDIESGTGTISFGPAPYLAAEDFLELQRMLRGRQPTWMSQEERISNELGATDAPGSKGDTVAGFDQPVTIHDPGGGTAEDGDGWHGTVNIEYKLPPAITLTQPNLLFEISNGRITNVTLSPVGLGSTSGTGTVGDPGAIIHFIEDTDT